ncbi:MAG: LytR C-terminal domain-containing protein [bacterium]|nr:LytR C-terminal domain-containing protein [bacterium]
MSQFIIKLKSEISRLRPRAILYGGVMLSFIIVVSILFFFSVRFIARNIDSAFLSTPLEQEQTLNRENYNIVAKKLGISTSTQKNALPTSTPFVIATTSASDTMKESVPGAVIGSINNQVTIDKSSLTIKILNSTTKSGSAGMLAEKLQSLGFAKAVTGNEATLHATSTIFLTEDMRPLEEELLHEVRKMYSGAIATTTKNSLFDITIIIGTN